MQLGNSAAGWGLVSRLLHWGMAVLLVLQWLCGEFDDWFGGRGLHLSLGLLLIVLVLMRLGWRLLAGPVPAPPPEAPRWETRLAGLTHAAWYLLLLALPATGLIYQQLRGRATSFFGVFELPVIMQPDKALAHQFSEAHEIMGIVVAVLLAVHVAAALKHHFVDRDLILRRMWRGPAS